MYEAFIDLDELIVKCRDQLSKKFIQEAVACYRAGAFRSCIVATWNAIVFDFLHKLRELELLGDGKAANLLQKFEKLSSEKKFKELWQFESDIPNLALTEFELISNVEKSDIERLFEDRSRCAHPSMTSLEEPFEATAELARYHLRSAVMHLLQRPPVQGRAAKTRIFQDIKSENFPVEPDRAIKHFQSSPLVRARFSLIKDIVLGLTVSLLTDDFSEEERARQFSALIAVSKIHPKETGEILNTYLSDIIINKVVDSDWSKVIIYLEKITAWDKLSEACQIKAKVFIENFDIYEDEYHYYKKLSREAIFILSKASHIMFLKQSVIDKLRIPIEDLLFLKEKVKDRFFRSEVIFYLLQESASKANFDELLSMRTDEFPEIDISIEPYLKEKIQLASLNKLVSVIFKYNDKWLNRLIEPELEEKINGSNLKSLLSAKSIYKSIESPKEEILLLFDKFMVIQVEVEADKLSLEDIIYLVATYEDSFLNPLLMPELITKIQGADLEELLIAKSIYESAEQPEVEILNKLETSIIQQIKIIDFETLLESRRHWDQISDDLLEPILKKNISTIINRFAKSGSFEAAGINANLLIRIAEYLSSSQWEHILECFFENSQISSSYSCVSRFETLFIKSLEIQDSVQPYWYTFREKLDEISGKYISSLKRLIDSYL